MRAFLSDCVGHMTSSLTHFQEYNSLLERNRVKAKYKEAFWTFIHLFRLPSHSFQLPLIFHKALLIPSKLPFLSNTSSLLFCSQQFPPKISPPSLSPSYPNATLSFTPPLQLLLLPSFTSTSFHSGFAPVIMSFLWLPLSLTHSNSALAASASPSLLYSYSWKLQNQILTVKDAFPLLDSLYPSSLFSHSCLQHNRNYLGRSFRSWKHNQFTGLWWYFVWIHLVLVSDMVRDNWFFSSFFLHTWRNTMEVILHSLIKQVVFVFDAFYQFIPPSSGKNKSLNSLSGPAGSTTLL